MQNKVIYYLKVVYVLLVMVLMVSCLRRVVVVGFYKLIFELYVFKVIREDQVRCLKPKNSKNVM